MNRADWQQIAEERLLAAQALLTANHWASAYYMAGYGVEGGLKSCILARLKTSPEVLFQEGGNKFSGDCWTHDIEKLVKLAGIKSSLDAEIAKSVNLGGNWSIVSQRNEKSRYQMKTQQQAQGLYDAITDNTDGVMQWIRARW